jgi:hypothetical protein
VTKTKASDIFNTGDPHLGGGYQIGYGEENTPVILSSPMTQADDRAPCAPPAPARSRVASSKPEVSRANYIPHTQWRHGVPSARRVLGSRVHSVYKNATLLKYASWRLK